MYIRYRFKIRKRSGSVVEYVSGKTYGFTVNFTRLMKLILYGIHGGEEFLTDSYPTLEKVFISCTALGDGTEYEETQLELTAPEGEDKYGILVGDDSWTDDFIRDRFKLDVPCLKHKLTEANGIHYGETKLSDVVQVSTAPERWCFTVSRNIYNKSTTEPKYIKEVGLYFKPRDKDRYIMIIYDTISKITNGEYEYYELRPGEMLTITMNICLGG